MRRLCGLCLERLKQFNTTMKLTNTIRDAFVRSAMNDVPSVDYRQHIVDIVMKEIVDKLPPKVRSVWDDPKTSRYVNRNWNVYGSVSVTHPAEEGNNGHISLTSVNAKKLLEFEQKKTAQTQHRSDLESKLRGAAYAVTTRKALVAMLPEFEKYLPADNAAACRTLPAVANIVADFTKAGWPKGKTRGTPA